MVVEPNLMDRLAFRGDTRHEMVTARRQVQVNQGALSNVESWLA